ncbi:MAG: M28 family peptidase, partial [Bacteroidetes bacterium]|nr:M28 family peptidase [Bacteroidota bacterium]
MKKSLFPMLLIASTSVFAQNLPPVISNTQFELSGNNLLTLTYDLEDAESDAVTVTFRATERGGLVFDFNTANATGDVGPGIASGTGKQIQWDYSAYATAQPDFRLMLVADDLQPVDIQAIVDQVDSTRLYDDLDFLEGIRHYTANPTHLQATKDFIEFQFQQNNLETYLHEFDYGNYGAANIIGRQIGTANEAQTYILGGHFDTVFDAPGADDNGSAVAGMLEAMRVLSPYSFKKSVKFIGFDLEEAGLVGSLKYVQNGILPGEGMAGMIDFEMIGYYSEAPNSQTLPAGFDILFQEAYNEVASQEFKGNFITDVGKTGNSQVLMDAYDSASTAFVPQLRVIPVEAPPAWQVLTPDLGRSDHAPFWVADIPAIMLTDGANFRNLNYHTPNDK